MFLLAHSVTEVKIRTGMGCLETLKFIEILGGPIMEWNTVNDERLTYWDPRFLIKYLNFLLYITL